MSDTLNQTELLAALTALLTQVDKADEAPKCGVETLEGTPCTRKATVGTTCKSHTPEKVKARDERVKRDEQAKAEYLATKGNRSDRSEVNRRAAAIAREYGFSGSGPEWAYVRDGLLEGKDEAVLRDTLKGDTPESTPDAVQATPELLAAIKELLASQ